jgi:hypothetical protein
MGRVLRKVEARRLFDVSPARPVHYAKVFELADQCGVLTDPELAASRMRQFLQVHAGIS